MRKLAIALGVTAAMLLAGSCAWKADATTLSSGTVKELLGRESRVAGRPVRPWLAPRLRSGALLVRALLACHDGAAIGFLTPPDEAAAERWPQFFFGG